MSCAHKASHASAANSTGYHSNICNALCFYVGPTVVLGTVHLKTKGPKGRVGTCSEGNVIRLTFSNRRSRRRPPRGNEAPACIATLSNICFQARWTGSGPTHVSVWRQQFSSARAYINSECCIWIAFLVTDMLTNSTAKALRILLHNEHTIAP